MCNPCAQDACRDLATALLASHARAEDLADRLRVCEEQNNALGDVNVMADELERMREILDICHRGIDSLWNAYHSGAWEMNHHDDDNDRPCPEDDTCECGGREAATLLSKASGMLTSWARIEAAKEPA